MRHPPATPRPSTWFTTLPLLGLCSAWPAWAQDEPRQRSAAELAAAIDHLAVAGSVLYVAAHPDDENSRLLAWLVGARGLRAGYLSLTRGDGGQNLIGPEQGDLLGVIRTYELLAARAIDGAEQLFTRAVDFGFSKSAEQTLATWGHDAVLGDVVRAIRRFRPDVIITRFTPKPPNHGHHLASALLAAEAFVAAADPARFSDPVAFPGRDGTPWQAARLLHNLTTWNRPHNEDLRDKLALDVGTYDPLGGRSWGEVAAVSRSQHKSQGFGVAAVRGPILEHFELLGGSAPPTRDPLAGLELRWRRFAGGEAVERAVAAAARAFDPRAPQRALPALGKVRAALLRLSGDNALRDRAVAEVDRLLIECAGLLLEARAEARSAVPGATLALTLTALARSDAPAQVHAVALPGAASAETLAATLAPHVPQTWQRKVSVANDQPVSTPLWLREPSAAGLHHLSDAATIGVPDAPAPLRVAWEVSVGGQRVRVVTAVVHVARDPVRGELRDRVEIAPALTLTPQRDVVLFPGGAPAALLLRARAGRDAVEGTIGWDLPAGWRAEPAAAPVKLARAGDEVTVSFALQPPPGATRPVAAALVAQIGGAALSWRQDGIDYSHIPRRTVWRPATVALAPLQLRLGGRRIGYLPGPGDRVAESLEAVGYQVTSLPEPALARAYLAAFDAIVVGVRAFNATPAYAAHRARLLRWVEQGGVLLVQYQTNSPVGPLQVEVGPYPLTIGRGRVTDARAPLVAVDAKERLLQHPNALTEADFAGWVQERGLYFAERWDPRYRPLHEVADPGEAPQRGATVVADYGKGRFVYTGLSFFRQLPAGVPGAYRLLANLLAR